MSELKRVFPILTVLFLGYLGFSLAIPLFPPLFLNPDLHFLPASFSSHLRHILLGILFAMYPIGQFIGAPLLGNLSDKFGRKPVILISLIIVIPAYILSAISVLYNLPLLLFVSRFLSGLLEGNIVIAQAAIADISESSKSKTKNFGWLVSLSSSAFFFGPLMGGKFADAKIVSWFHYDTPFWCAAVLSLVGFLVVATLFKETKAPNHTLKISIKKIFSTFFEGINISEIRPIYVANLFIFLAIFFFLNFFSAYLLNVYHFTVSLLGEINAYLSIPVILGPLTFGYFAKKWSTKKTTAIGAFLLGASFVIYALFQSPWVMLIVLLPIGFCMAVGFAFPALLVSNAAGKHFQGRALGTNQSIQVFAEAFTALTGGFAMALVTTFPIYLAALSAFIGGLALIFYCKKS